MVVDTSVIIALHLEEPGFETLFDKIRGSTVALVGTPMLLETAMVLAGRWLNDPRPEIARFLRTLRIQVVPFTETHLDAAIGAFLRFGKGRHPAALNFGDCLSYAFAAVSGQPLLYTGEGFTLTDVRRA
jgi:ribonuclease VapC